MALIIYKAECPGRGYELVGYGSTKEEALAHLLGSSDSSVESLRTLEFSKIELVESDKAKSYKLKEVPLD